MIDDVRIGDKLIFTKPLKDTHFYKSSYKRFDIGTVKLKRNEIPDHCFVKELYGYSTGMKDCATVYILPTSGVYKDIELYRFFDLNYCIKSDFLVIDYKYRRLRNLEHLDI